MRLLRMMRWMVLRYVLCGYCYGQKQILNFKLKAVRICFAVRRSTLSTKYN